MGDDAAVEEGVELGLAGRAWAVAWPSSPDKLRRVGAGGRLNLGDEGRGLLLLQAVQHGLFPVVVIVVDRGAIRRPLRPPTDGLHAMRLRW